MGKKVSYFTPTQPSRIYDFLPALHKISSDFDYGTYDLLVFLDFSEMNREAGNFIQKKIYQAEAFGQNNKQENLLENPKAMNAEVPVAEISAYTNAINRFSSPEEKIALFKSLFSGRKSGFFNL